MKKLARKTLVVLVSTTLLSVAAMTSAYAEMDGDRRGPGQQGQQWNNGERRENQGRGQQWNNGERGEHQGQGQQWNNGGRRH